MMMDHVVHFAHCLIYAQQEKKYSELLMHYNIIVITGWQTQKINI